MSSDNMRRCCGTTGRSERSRTREPGSSWSAGHANAHEHAIAPADGSQGNTTIVPEIAHVLFFDRTTKTNTGAPLWIPDRSHPNDRFAPDVAVAEPVEQCARGVQRLRGRDAGRDRARRKETPHFGEALPRCKRILE
jgi:hypothetical protein